MKNDIFDGMDRIIQTFDYVKKKFFKKLVELIDEDLPIN